MHSSSKQRSQAKRKKIISIAVISLLVLTTIGLVIGFRLTKYLGIYSQASSSFGTVANHYSPTGVLTCTPNLYSGITHGTAVISASWQNFVSGDRTAKICISLNGGAYKLFADGGGPNGSYAALKAPWIYSSAPPNKPNIYKFTLFSAPVNSTDCAGTVVASCTVTATITAGKR